MSTVRLNRQTILGGLASSGGQPGGDRGSHRGPDPAAHELTRRDAVAVAGAAAAVAYGAALAGTRLDPLPAPEFGATAGTAWLRAGSFGAVLDPARFGGLPSLLVSAGATWKAALTGATFPGTGLPADMELATIGSGATTRLGIRMALGGFSAEVPLSLWLAGERVATSRVSVRGVSLDLGPDSGLVLDGPATATLAAKDWTLRLEGDGIARVTGMGEDIVADAVTVSLAATALPSLLSRRISRRAVILLERGDRTWTLSAPASPSGGVSFSENAFDSISIESAETRSGATHVAMLASGAAAAGTYATRSGAAVPIRDVRFARLADNGSYHLTGQFTDWRTWMQGPHGALLVGAADWASPFEMIGDATGAKVTCSPAVYGIAAPLGNLIAAPITFPEAAQRVVKMGDTATKGPKAQAVNPVPGPTIAPGPGVIIPNDSSVTVTRPDDLLTLKFSFFNLSYSTSSGSPKLVRDDRTKPAYISVEFPPQHILERAFLEGVETPTAPPIQNFIAEPSRLAFTIPDSKADAGIDYTLAGLLTWTDYTHKVVPAIDPAVDHGPDRGIQMHKPFAGSHGSVLVPAFPPETSLEVPWGLYMSPSPGETWEHKIDPMTLRDRTELWHTRLHGEDTIGGLAVVPGPGTGPGPIEIGPLPVREGPPRLRAVWARYYTNALAGGSVPGTIIQRNDFTKAITSGLDVRWTVADLTTRFYDDPIKMRNLMLSPLGAWFDGRGEWDVEALLLQHPAPLIHTSLMEWDHRATMARDHYVKLVFAGRLFPFGHAASLIIITERKFKTTNGRRYAYLMQRKYIKVREPVRTYNFTDNGVRDRSFPFKRVEIKTLMTPPIVEEAIPIVSINSAFWPKTIATGQRTPFQIEATDWDGNVVKFNAPLIYMDVIAAVGGMGPESTGDAVNILCNIAYKAVPVDMAGQNIAYAKKHSDTSKGDERTLPTKTMYFDAERLTPPAAGENRFYPRMLKSSVRLQTVEKLTGNNTPTTIEIADQYKNNAFAGSNAQGMIFAKITTPTSPTFPGSLAGGLATPIPVFSGLGAAMGAIGGNLDQVAGGQFNPLDYFDSVLKSELLGGITLKDLLKVVLDLADMPSFKELPIPGIPEKISISFDWETKLDKAFLIFVPGTDCKIKLHAQVVQSIKVPPDPPEFTVTAELTDFTLSMVKDVFECVNLIFTSLKFESKNGSSPDCTPSIKDVEFVGSLKYLAELAKYAGSLGGSGSTALAKNGQVGALVTVVDSGPLKVDVDASGVTATLDIAIPDLSIGVFAMTNMSFGAKLKLPFTGGPVTLDFNFCSRESPFQITVMCWGGGGYVLLQFDSKGIVAVEISLEFGAGTSFSVGGIASGMVEIKGGMTLRWERVVVSGVDQSKLTFLVFIRIHGSLDVLGIIKVSLTFYLELKYETIPKLPEPGDKLTGTATLTIEIEILFFSFSVDLTVTKELAGKDPTFVDMLPVHDDWDAYCAAFAPAKLGA